MKRKIFLTGTIGMAAAGTMIGENKAMAQEQDAAACEKKLAGKNKFILGWVTAWLANMKKELSAAEMIGLIEENGRSCAANHGLTAWVKSFNGDIDKFIAAMRPHLGENNIRRDGSKVTLIYDKCLCTLVGDVPGTLPGEYCHCTVGWTQAVFGALTGKAVKVDLKGTIQRGDPKCQVEVELG
ncbi:MAG: hypothetical protein MUC72_08270 [Acidobacteria bacterium]|jgi:hypothetical protein|nr:hypothetical protein [Acidobacteriota bacterium]